MRTRYFVLIFGIIYLAIGILGFIPGLRDAIHDDHDMDVDASYGELLGLFPVNVLHNIVHIAVGILGIAAYSSFASARLYSRVVSIIFAVLTVMGLIPGLNTTFGLIPLFGNDIWLHALTALVTAYFGFMAPEDVEAPVRSSEPAARL